VAGGARLAGERGGQVAALERSRDGSGEHRAHQVVAAGRQRHLDLDRRAPVELRRPAGAGPAASGQPAVLDVEEPCLDETVEVEARGVHGHVGARGGLLPTDAVGLRGDEAVEPAAHRVGERPEGCVGLRHDFSHP